jgi:hypothetical protein
VYFRQAETGTLLVAVHVDDFLSAADSADENGRFKALLKTKWEIADLGEARFCLGIAIEWDRAGRQVALSQRALIDRIATQFGLADAHPVASPMETGLKLRRPQGPPSSEALEQITAAPYRSLVGSLMYLAVGTRPDIAYSVVVLSQFLSDYDLSHWQAAKRVVRYLLGSRDLRLHLGGPRATKLLGYTDADYGNCLNTRRSVSGYCFSLGSGLISWSSRKQKTVSQSSCEAEYVAASEASKEAIWLRALLSGLGFTPSSATGLLCDNNGAIALSKDPTFHSKVKHVDVRWHFIRERVADEHLCISYVNTADNVADAFTKALPPKPFERLRGFMGLH